MKFVFHVCQASYKILQFFFKYRDDIQGIVEKSPWYINNNMLILTIGDPYITPPFEDFEWIEECVHI